jgi:hypothetical protein
MILVPVPREAEVERASAPRQMERPFMKTKATHGARILLGLIFLVFGLNGSRP